MSKCIARKRSQRLPSDLASVPSLAPVCDGARYSCWRGHRTAFLETAQVLATYWPRHESLGFRGAADPFHAFDPLRNAEFPDGSRPLAPLAWIMQLGPGDRCEGAWCALPLDQGARGRRRDAWPFSCNNCVVPVSRGLRPSRSQPASCWRAIRIFAVGPTCSSSPYAETY